MNNCNYLLKDVLPDLAQEIKQKFLKYNRIDLYEQVDEVKIVSLCDCDENDCGSFFTVNPPSEEEDYKVEGFVIANGKVAVEVYDGIIGYVEIFPSPYGREIRVKLSEALGKPI